MCPKHCALRKKSQTPTMIPPASGESGAPPNSGRAGRIREVLTCPNQRSLRALEVGQPRVVRKYSPSVSCPFAICETAPCDESDRLACDRKRLQLLAQDVTVPMTDLCRDSNGFARRAFCFRRRALPIVSTDDRRARSAGTAPGIQPTHVEPCRKSLRRRPRVAEFPIDRTSRAGENRLLLFLPSCANENPPRRSRNRAHASL